MAKPDASLPEGVAAPARRAIAGGEQAGVEHSEEPTEAEVRQSHGMGPSAIELICLALAANGRSLIARMRGRTSRGPRP